MTVILDTSVLAAMLKSDDAQHDKARALMARILRGDLGTPVSSEHVLDEGLTLLRKRGGRRSVSLAFLELFTGTGSRPPPLHLLMTSREDLLRAAELHFRHYDRGLSMTDCVLAVLAQDLQAVVASFDGGFDGIVPRVSG